MRLAQRAAGAAANLVSMTAYVIAALLALAVESDEQVAACALLAIGIFCLGFDGYLARFSGRPCKPGSTADMVYTAGSSTALTFASLYWLVRADYLPWWSLLILAALTFGPEFLYIAPRKNARKSFVPVVLFGSWAYWIGVMVIYADMAGVPVYVAPLGLYVYSLAYMFLCEERLSFFSNEARL